MSSLLVLFMSVSLSVASFASGGQPHDQRLKALISTATTSADKVLNELRSCVGDDPKSWSEDDAMNAVRRLVKDTQEFYKQIDANIKQKFQLKNQEIRLHAALNAAMQAFHHLNCQKQLSSGNLLRLEHAIDDLDAYFLLNLS